MAPARQSPCLVLKMPGLYSHAWPKPGMGQFAAETLRRSTDATTHSHIQSSILPFAYQDKKYDGRRRAFLTVPINFR